MVSKYTLYGLKVARYLSADVYQDVVRLNRQEISQGL